MDAGVDSFRASLDADTLQMVDTVRAIITAAHPGLTELIKWNAPSFAIGGVDRITMGLERKGGLRVVLHRGAKPQALGNFNFEDRDGLARWPAPDRGIVVLRNKAEVDERAEALGDLCARWLAATA